MPKKNTMHAIFFSKIDNYRIKNFVMKATLQLGNTCLYTILVFSERKWFIGYGYNYCSKRCPAMLQECHGIKHWCYSKRVCSSHAKESFVILSTREVNIMQTLLHVIVTLLTCNTSQHMNMQSSLERIGLRVDGTLLGSLFRQRVMPVLFPWQGCCLSGLHKAFHRQQILQTRTKKI